MEPNSKNNALTEQLTKLSKLHADGVLSDEEFKALKAKLIAGITKAAVYTSAVAKAGLVKAAIIKDAAIKTTTNRAAINEPLSTNGGDKTNQNVISKSQSTQWQVGLAILMAAVIIGGVLFYWKQQEYQQLTGFEQQQRLELQKNRGERQLELQKKREERQLGEINRQREEQNRELQLESQRRQEELDR